MLAGEAGGGAEVKPIQPSAWAESLACAKPKQTMKTKYTVHWPGSQRYSYGPRDFDRVIVAVDTDDVVPTRTLASGPLLVNSQRKLRCNVRDNELGVWVRLDYRQLVDDEEGVVMTYTLEQGSQELSGLQKLNGV